HIDGLVHISTLANDYYHYDPIGQRLVGESFGAIYRLGDAVKVKVLAVNLDDRQIDFELVETSRKLRGQGKTAKKRAEEARAKAQGKKQAASKGGLAKAPVKSAAQPKLEATRHPDGPAATKTKKTKAPKKRKNQAGKKTSKAREKTK
ncbi:MAG: S1 RNA-binding domain-containing protein, partial [Vibrio sp.]